MGTTASTGSTPVLLDDRILAAFRSAAAAADPDGPTACRGWTAHDLLAHVVAGGAEIARLVAQRLAGGPDGPTEPFGVREPAFRALPYDVLVELLAGGTLGELFGAWVASDVATVRFTGWDLDVDGLVRHVESELVLHGWDLTAPAVPPVLTAALGRADLTQHAVEALTAFDVIGERAERRTHRMLAAGHAHLDVRLVVSGAPDVRLVADANGTRLDLGAPAGPGTTVECGGAADRLLLLWGRRPVGAPDALPPALAAWLGLARP